MVALNFDATKVEPDAGFETVPAGWYNVMITKDELKPTKAGTGSYLELTHDILDGQFKGRKLFARLNIVNPNVVAQEIAHKQLSGIARSVNMLMLQDSSQLLNIPFKVKVKLRKGGKNEQTGEDYEDQNEITMSKPASYDPGTPATVAAPLVPSLTPPPVAAAVPPPVAPAQQSWAPPPGAAPVAPPAPVAPVAPPAPVVPQYVMAPTETFTREQYNAAGWSDEALIKAGKMQIVQPPAPVAPPAPTAPAAPPAAPQGAWTPPSGAPAFGAVPATPPVADPTAAQGAKPPWGPQ